jgi:hypothetical protein
MMSCYFGWNFMKLFRNMEREDWRSPKSNHLHFIHSHTIRSLFFPQSPPFPAINYEVASGVVQNIKQPFRKINICWYLHKWNHLSHTKTSFRVAMITKLVFNTVHWSLVSFGNTGNWKTRVLNATKSDDNWKQQTHWVWYMVLVFESVTRCGGTQVKQATGCQR